MNNPFTGSGVALVTPFKTDMTIDHDAVRKLVRMQIDGGTDFLVVQGTTGESPTLSQEEKMELLQTVISENNGRLKIVYGVGGNNTIAVGETLKRCQLELTGSCQFRRITINQFRRESLSITSTLRNVHNCRLFCTMFLDVQDQI